MATHGASMSFIDLTADSDSAHDSDEDPELELEKLRASFTTRKHRTSPFHVKDVVTTSSSTQGKPRTPSFDALRPVKSVESTKSRNLSKRTSSTDTDYLSKAKNDTQTALHNSNIAIAKLQHKDSERPSSSGSGDYKSDKPTSRNGCTNGFVSTPLARNANTDANPPLLMPKTSKVPAVSKSRYVVPTSQPEMLRRSLEEKVQPHGVKRSADGFPKAVNSNSIRPALTNGREGTSKSIGGLPVHASLHCPESKCSFAAISRVFLLEHLVVKHGWSRSSADRSSSEIAESSETHSQITNANGQTIGSSDTMTAERTVDLIKHSVRSTPSGGFDVDGNENNTDGPTSLLLSAQKLLESRVLLNGNAAQVEPTAVSSYHDLKRQKKPITIKLNAKPQVIPIAISPLETDETRRLVADMQWALDNATSHANFLPEEDKLLIHLKEDLNMPWPDIYKYLPQRPARNGLNSRYSRCLKPEDRAIKEKTTKLRHQDPSEDAYQTERRRSTRTNIEEASRRGLYVPRLRLSRAVEEESCVELHKNHALAVLGNSSQRLEFNGDFSEDEPATTEAELGHVTRNFPNLDSLGGPIRRVSSLAHSIQASAMDIERGRRERHRDSAALASMTTRIFRSPIPESIRPSTISRHIVKPSTIQLRKKPSVDMQRPYLGYRERRYLQEGIDHLWNEDEIGKWDGKVLHVDFLQEEIERLEPSIRKVLHSVELQNDLDLKSQMSTLLKHASSYEIAKISARVLRKGVFINRTQDSVKSFLQDLAHHHVHAEPSLQRIVAKRPGNTTRSSVNKSLRARELGSRIRSLKNNSDLGQYMLETLGPHLTFKGTSGDVTNLAWSPDSNMFVAGSAAVVDTHSMQYNMPNNLLLGDVEEKTLRELPNHLIRRERPELGINASRDMFVSQDPYLFTTISSVAFSLDGNVMYSAGYDKYARVWDVRQGLRNTERVKSIAHHGYIDLLAVGQEGLFATGAQGSPTESVRAWKCNLLTGSAITRAGVFHSRRAIQSPDLQLSPSSMKWNTHHKQLAGHLLCGFSSSAKDFGAGEAWIWNIETLHWHQINCSRNIFDVAWSPSTFGQFAIACTAGGNVNKGTKSVVRIHHAYCLYNSAGGASSYVKPSYTYELECPALDMNDVVFNPSDGHLVSAGCTDGISYTWDLRNPDKILHQFIHGEALTPLDESRPPEESDTGIRFLSWDSSGRRLFTGSSDGIVAAWDPYRSTEDAHVSNVAKLGSAIMSGAFSPDFTSLALGEDQGKISIFSVGQDDKEVGDFEPFNFERADVEKADIRRRYQAAEDVPGDNESGIEAARQKLEQLEIEIKPLGDLPVRQAVQGPKYHGPYDTAADAHQLRSKAQHFQNQFRPSHDRCTLDHSISKVTEESKGDDGASRMMIPETYRFEPRASRKPPERCFRCGQPTLEFQHRRQTEDNDDDILRCSDCKLTWQADVLGYTLIDDEKHWPDKGSTQAKRWKIISDSDEDSVLEDYYHHLWQDRPASPL